MEVLRLLLAVTWDEGWDAMQSAYKYLISDILKLAIYLCFSGKPFLNEAVNKLYGSVSYETVQQT